MTWLSQLLAKSGIKNPLSSRQSRVPAGLWTKCAACSTNILTEKLMNNLNVCEYCQHHHPLSIKERIKSIMDPNFKYIDIKLPEDDPLNFVDTKEYKKRLKDARGNCTFKDAFAVVDGTISDMPAISVFMDFNFIGGSMGIAVGNAIVKAAQIAVERRIPAIIFTSSGGARMQEGLFALMQMPRTVIAVDSIKKAGVPYIVVMTYPTTGGVLASFASRATFTLAEPGAVIGFTGARVIKDTLGIKLPKGFQTAEFIKDKGFIDAIISRKAIKSKLTSILSIFNLDKTTI